MTYLAELTAEVEKVNREKGWYDEPRSFGDLIALLHSEVSEMLEAYRAWGTKDATYNGPTPPEDRPTVYSGADKPEGVGVEAADLFIRLLDLCARCGIDLEAETERKLAYNRTRSHRHGGRRL